MTDFDFSELDRLAKDLGEVASNAGPFINSAVQFTSVEIKKAAQKSVSKGDKRWRAAAATIDYEVKTFQGFGASVIESEIGYDKDKVVASKSSRTRSTSGPGTPGNLGHLREFGKPNLAPHNDLQTALAANTDDFEKGLAQALEDAEKKAGL